MMRVLAVLALAIGMTAASFAQTQPRDSEDPSLTRKLELDKSKLHIPTEWRLPPTAKDFRAKMCVDDKGWPYDVAMEQSTGYEEYDTKLTEWLNGRGFGFKPAEVANKPVAVCNVGFTWTTK